MYLLTALRELNIGPMSLKFSPVNRQFCLVLVPEYEDWRVLGVGVGGSAVAGYGDAGPHHPHHLVLHN